MLQLLSQPEMLRQVSLRDLRRVVEDYPCFAAARMLFVKALKERGDLDYPQELFKASLQAPSRRQLFLCIQGRKLLISNAEPTYAETYVSEMPVEEPTTPYSDDFSLIDKFLDEQSVQGEQRQTDMPLAQSSVYNVEEALGDGSDVEEDNDVIRRFLETNPPSESGREVDVSVNNAPDSPEGLPKLDVPVMPEAAFTLTLARIYLRQKKYDRALEIFRSLVLKNPEKSIYFADQIRYLEKVINNLNK